MTVKKIQPSSVLGNKFYVYELSSSNYTPALNASITITCKCTNVYGENVASKSLTLYQNGTSQGAKTTNSNGVATWTITCSNGGLQKFSIGDTSIDVFVDTKSENTHTHGNLSNDGKISQTSSATMLYFTGVGATANTLYKSNKLDADCIVDDTAYINIGSSANDTQSTINSKINTILGNIQYGTFEELQDLIDNTPTGGTLVLNKNYQNLNDEFEGLEIEKRMNIVGNGHILNANNKSAIFQQLTAQYISFDNIIMVNGAKDDWSGGAIMTEYHTTIKNCTFLNCHAGTTGGAINDVGNCIITNCEFINCDCIYEEHPQDACGGAIYCSGENTIISNCLFANNQCNNGGAIYIYVANNSTLDISDCIFIGNSVNAVECCASGMQIYDCILKNNSLVNTTNVSRTASIDLATSSTGFSSTLTDTKPPSEKLIKEYVDGLIEDIQDYIYE